MPKKASIDKSGPEDMKAFLPDELIEQKIFLIRGERVMLDRDLAELYGVSTGVLNQAVKRNSKRFPSDFKFSLTRPEIMNLSQIVISSRIKHAPNVNAFTENGVAMLSGVLNSDRAIQVNIQIMRTFTRLRKLLASHKEILGKLTQHELKIHELNKNVNKLGAAMRYLFLLPMIVFLACPAFADQGVKVYAVSGISPQVDVRIAISNEKQRTDNAGMAYFEMPSPGSVKVKGPGKEIEAYIRKDSKTIAVLQTEDVKLKVNKEFLGKYTPDGGTFPVTITYNTPQNYKVAIEPVNVPVDWKVSIDPKEVKPDTKATVTITVPEGSQSQTDAIQFVAYHDKQIIAVTKPMSLIFDKSSLKTNVAAGPVNNSINYKLQTTRSFDQMGTMFDTDLDLYALHNIGANISTQVLIRLTHNWQPQDAADYIDFRLASITYLSGLFNLSLGRLDLYNYLQPASQYFGSYLTMGQHRFDGVYFFLPFSLSGSAGVLSESKFDLPKAAFSCGYFPNFFSFDSDVFDFKNGFVFASFKLPVLIGNDTLMTSINYSFTTDYAYLKYSPLSGDPAASINVDYTLSRNYKVYTEFAIGNFNYISDTTALMAGSSAVNLTGMTLGIIDEVCIDYQVPLISSLVNPFVGGNTFYSDQAQAQHGAWFVRAVNHFNGLEITLAATNSIGDFTFARPAANSFIKNAAYVLNDRRTANEVKGTGKTLLSSSYDKIAYSLTVGTNF